MNEKTIQTLLNATFPKSDKEAWATAASGEIKKENPLESLSWATRDGLSLLPIYDKKDISELKYLNAFSIRTSKHAYQGNRSWINMPCVIVHDESAANKIALQHLSNGADGILFDLQTEGLSITKLLYKIEWPHCHISFTGKTNSYYEDIKQFATGIESALQGSLWTTKAIINIEALTLFSDKKIHSIGIVIPSSTPVNEIVYALKTAVNYSDELTNKGVDATTAINAIAFSIAINAEIFIEVAKLKTLRLLWYQITQAYGVKSYQPENLHIHARIEPGVDDKFQPHGNLIKSTLSALASVLGGCDSLTVYAEDEHNTMMNRVARNVSNILREESHLNKVADPIAGAYAVENIINELGKKAWEEFSLTSTR